jgi:hypothetical protein
MILGREDVPHCDTLPMSVNDEVRETGSFKLTNKYATARENINEWIQIVRARPLEKVKGNLRATTGNPRENLNRWIGRAACACHAAHNKDTAIGHNKCGRVPTSTLCGNLIEHRSFTCAIEVDTPAYLQLEVVWVFLPVIGAIDPSRTIRGIKTDTYGRVLQPATNIEDTRGLVRKHDGGRAPHIRLDMHFAPSMIKIIDETQVEFVCASRVLKLRRSVFLEERNLAVYTDRSKQRRHKTRDEVLNQVVARLCVYAKGDFRAYLVSADIGRGMPVVQRTIPKIELQPLSTSAKM